MCDVQFPVHLNPLISMSHQESFRSWAFCSPEFAHILSTWSLQGLLFWKLTWFLWHFFVWLPARSVCSVMVDVTPVKNRLSPYLKQSRELPLGCVSVLQVELQALSRLVAVSSGGCGAAITRYSHASFFFFYHLPSLASELPDLLVHHGVLLAPGKCASLIIEPCMHVCLLAVLSRLAFPFLLVLLYCIVVLLLLLLLMPPTISRNVHCVTHVPLHTKYSCIQ